MKPEYITTAVWMIICTYFFIKSITLKNDNKKLDTENDKLSQQLELETSAKNRLATLCDEKDVKIAQLKSDNNSLDQLICGHTDVELEMLAENNELNKRIEELLFDNKTLKAIINHKKKPTKKMEYELEENYTIG